MGRAALDGFKQVTVKSDLKEMFWPGTACEFGVPRLIRPSPARTAIINAYEEIGVAEPRTCCERRLINQGDAAIHSVDRSGEARIQRTGRDFDEIAAPLFQPGQTRGFMFKTLSDDESRLRVGNGLGGLAQTTASFQGPRRGRAAPQKCRGERGREFCRAGIKVVRQNGCSPKS